MNKLQLHLKHRKLLESREFISYLMIEAYGKEYQRLSEELTKVEFEINMTENQLRRLKNAKTTFQDKPNGKAQN